MRSTPAQGIVLFDVLDLATQLEAGRQLLRLSRQARPLHRRLVRRQLRAGEGAGPWAPPASPALAAGGPHHRRLGQLLAHHGAPDPPCAGPWLHRASRRSAGACTGDEAGHRSASRAEASRLMGEGRSVLVYTALDPETDQRRRAGRHSRRPPPRGPGAWAASRAPALRRCGLKRAILAGGDTSSHALGELDVFALTTRFPLARHTRLAPLHGGECRPQARRAGDRHEGRPGRRR